MLLGQYQPSMDDKGRVSFPAKLREDLGSVFVITKGREACLQGYPCEAWKALEEKMNALSSQYNDVKRFFFANAVTVEPDKQGRILIPTNLREYAKLDKDITVIGVSDKIEIWNTEIWNSRTESLTPENIAAVLDSLGL